MPRHTLDRNVFLPQRGYSSADAADSIEQSALGSDHTRRAFRRNEYARVPLADLEL